MVFLSSAERRAQGDGRQVPTRSFAGVLNERGWALGMSRSFVGVLQEVGGLDIAAPTTQYKRRAGNVGATLAVAPMHPGRREACPYNLSPTWCEKRRGGDPPPVPQASAARGQKDHLGAPPTWPSLF